jgi:hypothetical protein
LREFSKTLREKPAELLSVVPATRWRLHSSGEDGLGGQRAGDNPPSGAIIHYWLRKTPKDEVTLKILDSKGALVRKLSSKAKEDEKTIDVGAYSDPEKDDPDLTTHYGMNRVVWDLTHEAPKSITKARTDGGSLKAGPLVMPGTYTLELTVDGQTSHQPMTVLIDPRWAKRVTENHADQLQKQAQDALKIRDDITRLSEMVERLRAVKKQLTARNELLKDEDTAKDLIKASKDFITRLDEVEGKLHNPKAQVSYDILAQKGGAKLYSQLTWLYGLINDADGPTTQGWKEVYEEQRAELDKLEGELNKLFGDELAKLNEQAKKAEAPQVIVPKPVKKP